MSSRFWDRIAGFYSKKAVPDPEAYQKKLELTQSHLKPDFEVLEFGCGTGSTAILHAPLVKRYVATDFSKRMIEFAQQRTQEAGAQNVECVQTTLFDSRFKAESYDAVLGLNVIHLMDDLEGTLTRVRELLKPNGLFFASVPCVGEEAQFLKYVLPIGSFFGLLPNVNFFTIDQFEQAVRKVGFNILSHSTPGKDKTTCFTVAAKTG